MEKNRSVAEYIQKHPHWQAELTALREIVQSVPLQETIKWGAPVYTLDGKNLVGLGAFTSYVGLWFFQGALLTDPERRLINAQEGKTRALRQWRFASLEEIREAADTIRAYLREAIDLQRQGKSIKPQRDKPLDIPPELQAQLSGNRELKAKFEALSKSKRREYAEYIAEAKREETRQNRLDKIIPMILGGLGLNDKYRK